MTRSTHGERLSLGAFLYFTGHHVAAWRDPSSWAGDQLAHYTGFAQIAEAAKLDAVFIADNPAIRLDNPDAAAHSAHSGVTHFEPLTLLSAIAATTQRIGLIATASTTFSEPYNLARQVLSLDHLSAGRAGWNLVTTSDHNAAPNFGHAHHVLHADRYARAEEFVDIVKGLWDSFDDDAFLRDRESGRYYDPAKMHTLHHQGEHFSVRGPLNAPRSVQGRPVIVQAGSSETGKTFAARSAEVIFTAQPTIESARAFYADLKQRAVGFGRQPGDIRILPGLFPVVGRTEAEAQAKFQALQERVLPVVGLNLLENLAGRTLPLRDLPLDSPLPDLPRTNNNTSRQDVVLAIARRENLTLRQLYLKLAGPRGHLFLTGTPETIADTMQAWFESHACDGFNLLPPTIPDGLTDFTEQVLPELRRRGLFRHDYEGSTLREHLGLQRPQPKRRTA
ncbi:MAG: LLM class flavin-dependent oxidoreductase [Comamonas sp.]